MLSLQRSTDKNKPVACGIYMGSHGTKSCSNSENNKCVNCVRNGGVGVAHTTRSIKCPVFLGAKNSILSLMNFNAGETNALPPTLYEMSEKNY